MSSVYNRNGQLWARLKVGGRWVSKRTRYLAGEEDLARRYATRRQERIDDEETQGGAVATGPLTLRDWAASWVDKRRQLGLDWKGDQGKLAHVLAMIGDDVLATVRSARVAEVVHKLRTEPSPFTNEPRSPRTVHAIYRALHACLRDAAIAGKVEANPCILTASQLGPLVDSDPEWRDTQVFSVEEMEEILSTDAIPFDRRMYYALMLLGGVRPGEIAALRVSDYDPNMKPLGRITVSKAHADRDNVLRKSTKTHAIRKVPVHPTLAAMLGEWLLSGYEAMTGKRPEPSDLLLPLPPTEAAKRRKRKGEPVRSTGWAGVRWRLVDEPAIFPGRKHREMYAAKSAFISNAIEDGAEPEIIRDRVTHTKSKRDAFSGYDRKAHWIRTCEEVSKLQVQRRHVRPRGAVIALPSSSESTPDLLHACYTDPIVVGEDASTRGSCSRRCARSR